MPALVAGSRRIALLQRRLAELLPLTLGIRALSPPVEVGQLVEAMWWHPAYDDDDPEHAYLRDLVTRATELASVAREPPRAPSMELVGAPDPPSAITSERPTGQKAMDDETQIRQLIERWATAVHAGDLAAVLADHAEQGDRWTVTHEHHSFAIA